MIEATFAARTIVAIGLLQARLNDLLMDQTLCRRFGEMGKSRVRAKFLWKNVITQFSELWHEQHSISKSIETKPMPVKKCSELFNGYATCYLDEQNSILSCGLSEIQQFQKVYGASDPRFPILGFCLRPQSFESLVQRFGPGVQVAVIGLLKKGFVRFVE